MELISSSFLIMGRTSNVKVCQIITDGIGFIATLALVGWYLMTPPPIGEAPRRVDANAPISKWLVVGSFDTAEQCETSRLDLQNDYPNDPTAVALAKQSLKCIATDDPRLKGN
jgi:hypothetical protein